MNAYIVKVVIIAESSDDAEAFCAVGSERQRFFDSFVLADADKLCAVPDAPAPGLDVYAYPLYRQAGVGVMFLAVPETAPKPAGLTFWPGVYPELDAATFADLPAGTQFSQDGAPWQFAPVAEAWRPLKCAI